MTTSDATAALRSIAAAFVVAVTVMGAAGCIGNGDDNVVAVAAADAGAARDATVPATEAAAPNAACMSDGSRCNSCVTRSADPYNACSPYAPGCIPFDAARVPVHPTL